MVTTDFTVSECYCAYYCQRCFPISIFLRPGGILPTLKPVVFGAFLAEQVDAVTSRRTSSSTRIADDIFNSLVGHALFFPFLFYSAKKKKKTRKENLARVPARLE